MIGINRLKNIPFKSISSSLDFVRPFGEDWPLMTGMNRLKISIMPRKNLRGGGERANLLKFHLK